MAVSAYVDAVALNTGTGDQTVSPGSLAFTPTGVVFSGNLNTADGGQADATWMMGVAGLTQRYAAFESEDASPSSDVGAVALSSGCMSMLADNNLVDYIGSFTSFNASPAGFTFNLSDAPAAASLLPYLLLGGDVTGIEPFVFNVGSGAGNKSLATLSGTPACVVFFCGNSFTTSDTFSAGTANGTSCLGWMCADGTQGYAMTRHTDASATTSTARRQRTNKCFGEFSVSAEFCEAHFVSMDATGFTVNLVNAPSANTRIYGFAIYGGTWTAGSFLSTTGTGGGNAVATPGVNPVVSLFLTYGLGANTTTQSGAKRGFGACDGTRRWALAYDDVDAAPDSIADSYLDQTRALVSITAGTPTLDDAYDITHGVEQFTYDHEVASGVAIQVLYLVGGDVPGLAPAPVSAFSGTRRIHRLAPVRWG